MGEVPVGFETRMDIVEVVVVWLVGWFRVVMEARECWSQVGV
jgi:hypothetical protein